ncbi:hypothetical protein WJX74_007101 [Apatococcus lobatus]|uniref:Histone deacetylase domain-containing protein n=1 Tax=Apatococcus lobatus TaxID=904363 RepID=A0AAW1R422_9CHLO
MKPIGAMTSDDLLDRLQQWSSQPEPCKVADLDSETEFTYVTETTHGDALQAATAAVALVDAVCGEVHDQPTGASSAGPLPHASVGFGLIRPPGHHATRNEVSGFCMLNNIAIAARHAQTAHSIDKVMIVDFDVHHGNGTQDAFYSDPNVLFVDMHEQGVWPGSGNAEETGAGLGIGTTINIPLPVGSGDAAARLAWHSLVAPAARRFQPGLLLVSAGYDAHWRDPLEKQQFQSSTYHFLTQQLKALADELCGGKLLLLLEGGYSLQGLSEGAAESICAILGGGSCHLDQPGIQEPLDEVLACVKALQALHGLLEAA